MQWARLQVDTDCALRRGAWYRVTKIGTLESVLDVNRRPHAVPSYIVQIASTPPRRWTVVPRPPSAARLSPHLSSHYVVCPSCRERAPLAGTRRPRALGCKRCRGVFEVAWAERYLDR